MGNDAGDVDSVGNDAGDVDSVGNDAGDVDSGDVDAGVADIGDADAWVDDAVVEERSMMEYHCISFAGGSEPASVTRKQVTFLVD